MPARTDVRHLTSRRHESRWGFDLLHLPKSVLWVMGAACGVLVLMIIVLAIAQHTQTTTITAQHAALTSLQEKVKVLAAQPTDPHCSGGKDLLSTIATQEQAAQWHAAAQNAETALANPELCPEARAAFAAAAVGDHLADLLAAPIPPDDVEAQRLLVARYEATKALAHRHGIPVPMSPLQVAREAYAIEAFLLAKHAFENAAGGHDDHYDVDQRRFHADILYNLGFWWTRTGQPDAVEEGWHLIAASCALSRRDHLGRHEAEALLRQHFGDDERAWPLPAGSPFLDTAPSPAPPAGGPS